MYKKNSELLLFGYIILFSVILTCFFVILSLNTAKKYNIYDHPDERKIHKNPIPRTGGIAIFSSFITLSIFTKLWNYDYFLPFLLANTLIFLTGFADDKLNLKATTKLISQFVAASIIIFACGIRFKIGGNYTGFWNLEFASIILTYLWIIGVTNAINLIDGMDGLASGIALFAFGGIILIALNKNYTFAAIVASIFFGSLVSFLSFNLPKAIIFLGDSGSLLLGFNLAIMSLNISYKTGTIISVIFPSLFVLIPVIDTVAAFVRRILKKQNPLKTPDKKHIHHKLILLKFSHNQALIIFYILSGIFTTIAVNAKSKNLLKGIVISLSLIFLFWIIIYAFEKSKVDQKINKFNEFTNKLKEKITHLNNKEKMHLFIVKISFAVFYTVSLYFAFKNHSTPKEMKNLYILLIFAYLCLISSAKILKTESKNRFFISFWIDFLAVYFILSANFQPVIFALLIIAFPFFFYRVFLKKNLILIFPSPTDILILFSIINICLFSVQYGLNKNTFIFAMIIYLFKKAIFKEIPSKQTKNENYKTAVDSNTSK